MNIFSNLRLFSKFAVHTTLFIVFVLIFVFSQTNFVKHTQMPFVLLFVWLFHLYLNKQFFISFFSGKLKGREPLYKAIISIALFFLILCTILFGSTMMNGVIIPVVSITVAYTYHGTLAMICLLFLLLHLYQNKRALLFVWKKVFK